MNASKGCSLVSVIVPVYNVEKKLCRCVDSILCQTYSDLEVLLVDDGSSDRSGAICDEYVAKDNRVKVIHQENGGVSAARNAGLDICTGDYICFLDSDDYILPEMYEKMLFTLIEEQVDICVCQWNYECTDGKQVVDMTKVDKKLFGKKTSTEFARFLYKGSYENGVVVSACNKMYARAVFNEMRFCGRYAEDDEIHNRILSKDYSVFVMDKQYYIYAENQLSLSKKPFRKESLRFLDILDERTRLFVHDSYILQKSRLLYCNIYIEYYFKAKQAKITTPVPQTFDRIVRELVRSGHCSAEFLFRMLLFRSCPVLYHALLVR